MINPGTNSCELIPYEELVLNTRFDIMVGVAKEMGPLMCCDWCITYWPVNHYDKKLFTKLGGELICQLCWNRFQEN